MSALNITLDSAAARTLTDQIKAGVEAVWELVKRAYIQRAWSALGYTSWDDYCTREFGTTRLRLPREERAEVVASLRESGLSLRAIEAAVGLNRRTVMKDISASQVVHSAPPEPIDTEVACDGRCAVDECVCPADDGPTGDANTPPEPRNTVTYDHGCQFVEPGEEIKLTTRTTVDTDTGEIVSEVPLDPSTPADPQLPENYAHIPPGGVTDATPGQTSRVAEALAKAQTASTPQVPTPKPITGLDGKTYNPKPVNAHKPPKRKPITDAFDSANYELRRAVERVVRLCGDDRMEKNKDQIVGANLSDLIRARDAIASVIQQLEG